MAAPGERKVMTFRGQTARIVQHEVDHLTGTFFVDRIPERKKKEALDRFYNWKAMRRAQIRKSEENGNVHTRFVTAVSGQSRLS